MTDPAPARTGAPPAAGRYSETALSGIYEISKIVTSPASLKVMLNNVVSVMSSFLDMRLATLALLDEKGDPEINVSASTEHELASGEDTGIPMAVIDQIVATATPLAVQNCALHPLFAGWKRLGRVDPGYVQTFIGVPIRVDSEVAGTLAIERVWKGTMDVRIDHDVRFLTMVANLLGQALKLHRAVSEDRERLMLEQARLAKELSSFKSPRSQRAQALRHPRQEPRHPQRHRPHRAGRQIQRIRAHSRRNRHGQGAVRPRHPRAFLAQGQALHQGELRGAARKRHRIRAVRP